MSRARFQAACNIVIVTFACTAAIACAAPIAAASGPASACFTTLGTNAGPIPITARAEPANLLRAAGQNVLIDAGDGAAWQLAKVGVAQGDVQTVLLSHLHFDHTGGLFAFLGQRYQAVNAGALTIYGPPGTKALVDGLIGAVAVSFPRPVNARQSMVAAPGSNVSVVEIGGGTHFTIGTIAVTTATNSHYSIAATRPEYGRIVSLSFRFDVPREKDRPARAIVYTGDTGPSAAVEQLAKGADLLVSEIMDPEAALAQLRHDRPDMPGPILNYIGEHFRHEHMSPNEAGLLASRAGVRSLVLTHIAVAPGAIPATRMAIKATFKGPVRFARDLDTF